MSEASARALPAIIVIDASMALALARGQGLSSYHATYLELAQRLGAALASFDHELNRASRAIGVLLFAEI